MLICEGPLSSSSPSLRRIYEADLKLKGIMLDIQRLRGLVTRAEAEVHNRRKSVRLGQISDLGCLRNTSLETIATRLTVFPRREFR